MISGSLKCESDDIVSSAGVPITMPAMGDACDELLLLIIDILVCKLQAAEAARTLGSATKNSTSHRRECTRRAGPSAVLQHPNAVVVALASGGPRVALRVFVGAGNYHAKPPVRLLQTLYIPCHLQDPRTLRSNQRKLQKACEQPKMSHTHPCRPGLPAEQHAHPIALERQLGRRRALTAVELAQRRVQRQRHLHRQQVPQQLPTLRC